MYTLYPPELLYPLQDGLTPLHFAARGGHTTSVEHLLSTPGIDVNITDKVNVDNAKNSILEGAMSLCQVCPFGYLNPSLFSMIL